MNFKYHIIKHKEKNNDFYLYMAKVFSNKKICNEIGSPVHDCDYDFVLVLDELHKLVAFASFNEFKIQDIYVFEHVRDNGICKIMIDKIMNLNNSIHATCNNNSLNIFLSKGFFITKSYKNWHKVKYVKHS